MGYGVWLVSYFAIVLFGGSLAESMVFGRYDEHECQDEMFSHARYFG